MIDIHSHQKKMIREPHFDFSMSQILTILFLRETPRLENYM